MEIKERKTDNVVSLCEKFEMPMTSSYEEVQTLLEQRFEIAKKLYFPGWEDSWWDTHIPSSEFDTKIVEWFTHMPKEYLVNKTN